jgi:hypothetical protein
MLLGVSAQLAFGADPANLLAYKKRVISGLRVAYNKMDQMHDARFVKLSVSPVTTINKTIVYYDSIKALWELNELCYDRNGLTSDEIELLDQIPAYIDKSRNIIAQYYIQGTGGGGYKSFPHGLGYIYQCTGDLEAYEGLVALRNKGNWVNGLNQARENIIYAREVAYTIQIVITAIRLGVSVSTEMKNRELIQVYIQLALSQLEQWHSGKFYGEEKYRSTFVVGLLVHSLIEYYERIDSDPRIPPAIKKVLDDVWITVWHPDVTNPTPTSLGDTASYKGLSAEGAFWTWADWVTDRYVIDRNHNPNSPDVSATHNMLIGPAYAWYAVYSRDESYLKKAVDTFNGTAANLSTYTPSGQLWEGIRYSANFIRWYRKFYNTPCASGAIEQCEDPSSCATAGGNWTGEWCQHSPVKVRSLVPNPWSGGVGP